MKRSSNSGRGGARGKSSRPGSSSGKFSKGKRGAGKSAGPGPRGTYKSRGEGSGERSRSSSGPGSRGPYKSREDGERSRPSSGPGSRGPYKRREESGGERPRPSGDSERGTYKPREENRGERSRSGYGERSERSSRSRSTQGEGSRYSKDDRAPRSYSKGSRDDRPKRTDSGEGNRSRPYTGADRDRPFSDRQRSGERRPGSSRSGDERSPRSERPYSDRGDRKPYSGGERSRKFSSDKRSFAKRDKPFGKGLRETGFDKDKFPSRDRSGDREEKPFSSKDENQDSEFTAPKREKSSERDSAKRPTERFGDKRVRVKKTEEGDTNEPSTPERVRERPSDRDSSRGDKRLPSKERFSSPRPDGDRKWNRKEDHKFYGDKKKTSKSAPREVDDGSTRLNKFIANAGICSRREADELISAGVVSVNGKVITEMGYKVMPDDNVKYNNELLRSEQLKYVLLNKPKDFITTTDDPEDRKTVMNLIAKAGRERIYPVGRLDRNTTGLLLFTNDGELARRLTHPSFQVHKVYQVELDRSFKASDMQAIVDGLTLEDGPVKVDEIVYAGADKNILGIEIHSGRNRIVRRIFEHLGYEVKKLDRVVFAGLTKKDLPRGRWRFLTEMEISGLKMLAGKKALS